MSGSTCLSHMPLVKSACSQPDFASLKPCPLGRGQMTPGGALLRSTTMSQHAPAYTESCFISFEAWQTNTKEAGRIEATWHRPQVQGSHGRSPTEFTIVIDRRTKP